MPEQGCRFQSGLASVNAGRQVPQRFQATIKGSVKCRPSAADDRAAQVQALQGHLLSVEPQAKLAAALETSRLMPLYISMTPRGLDVQAVALQVEALLQTPVSLGRRPLLYEAVPGTVWLQVRVVPAQAKSPSAVELQVQARRPKEGVGAVEAEARQARVQLAGQPGPEHICKDPRVCGSHQEPLHVLRPAEVVEGQRAHRSCRPDWDQSYDRHLT